MEAAIPETIAETATAEVVIPETATAKVQHQAVIMEVLHRVLIMAIATVEIQVQMEQCQCQIVALEQES